MRNLCHLVPHKSSYITPPSIAPLLRSPSSSILWHPPTQSLTSQFTYSPRKQHYPHITTNVSHNMSFSNANTGDKPADPYKATNMDAPELKEKIETLVTFITGCKFGMMTTKTADSELLVSRCMALAATVSSFSKYPFALPFIFRADYNIVGRWRRRSPLPYQHRIRQNR